ncbi:hypothetical protein GQ607_017864 [Colletotrichum asianum]|uniref:Uncharacterized protein n=1 Tax=Colletotrichum asianum TaxID=702518 RepID=A0A8H3VWS3_9PEZI|nr:hypothetical protein GQ607_017864 [Colletotrichum asianum]
MACSAATMKKLEIQLTKLFIDMKNSNISPTDAQYITTKAINNVFVQSDDEESNDEASDASDGDDAPNGSDDDEGHFHLPTSQHIVYSPVTKQSVSETSAKKAAIKQAAVKKSAKPSAPKKKPATPKQGATISTPTKQMGKMTFKSSHTPEGKLILANAETTHSNKRITADGYHGVSHVTGPRQMGGAPSSGKRAKFE